MFKKLTILIISCFAMNHLSAQKRVLSNNNLLQNKATEKSKDVVAEYFAASRMYSNPIKTKEKIEALEGKVAQLEQDIKNNDANTQKSNIDFNNKLYSYKKRFYLSSFIAGISSLIIVYKFVFQEITRKRKESLKS